MKGSAGRNPWTFDAAAVCCGRCGGAAADPLACGLWWSCRRVLLRSPRGALAVDLLRCLEVPVSRSRCWQSQASKCGQLGRAHNPDSCTTALSSGSGGQQPGSGGTGHVKEMKISMQNLKLCNTVLASMHIAT